MRRVLTKRLSILVLASLILCGFGVSAYAYDISGTVRNASGTPINGTADQIQVTAFQGDSCGWIQWKGSAPIDTNGGYTISGLLDGDYYLQTDNTNNSDYVNEWWTGGGDPSSYNCNDAVSIPVSGSNVTGKDFWLDPGGRVSGNVSDGATGITGVRVQAYTGKCWDNSLGGATTDGSGNYTIYGIPSGGAYIHACATCEGSNFVDEWWGNGDGTTNCDDAQPVTGGTTGLNFTLDQAFSISGTVADSSGPITDMADQIQVIAWQGDPCESRQWVASALIDASGTYTISGLSAGDYYLQTDNMNQSNYLNEWWTGASDPSSYNCIDAQLIAVSGDVIGKVFELEQGGTLSGQVLDYNSVPQANVNVNYGNEALDYWSGAVTDGSGQFQLSGLPPGGFDIVIKPEVNTGLAWFTRDSYLDAGDTRDLGTIRLQKGALVSGHINHDGAPLPEVEYYYGGRFEMGWGETDTNGYFEVRLPVGSYALSLEEDEGDEVYVMVPVQIDVIDVNATYDLDNLPVQGRVDRLAYDSSNGEAIAGTVSGTTGNAHHGEFEVVAFLNDQDFSPDNAGGIGPLGLGHPTPAYTLYVPPAADYDRNSRDVLVALALFSEDPDGTESMTIVDVVPDLGPPYGDVNLTYASAGQTVDGYVKDTHTSEGIYYASALLYSQPGDVFAGFADTDGTGEYVFYNVPPGTYRIAVTARDYTDTLWSSNFDVVAQDVNVPDILMTGFIGAPGSISGTAMPWIPLLLLDE